MAMARRRMLPLLLVLLVSCRVLPAPAAAADNYDGGAYPSYCLKQDIIDDARGIPELSSADLALKPNLTLVIAVTRHGARTLADARPLCWPGYNISWDCSFATSVAPSNFSSASEDTRVGPILFTKTYDGAPTFLGGTCAEGALISEGYSQQKRLGELLRAAYIGPEPHRLFPTAELAALPQGALYLRSDDMQRTAASGQALVAAFFERGNDAAAGVALPWHMGDLSRDDIYDNAVVCPRLAGAKAAAENTAEYKEIWTGPEATALQSELDAVLGAGIDLGRLHDCLLTAVCADKPVPAGVLPRHVSGVNTLAERAANITYTFNDSIVARLAMGPLISDILPLVRAAVSLGAAGSGGGGDGSDVPSFALYSAHDSTVMPLVAALAPAAFAASGGEWAGYASLVSIEIYSAAGGAALFRAIYNGRVLPLAGCGGGSGGDQDLCDVKYLLESMGAAVDVAASCRIPYPRAGVEDGPPPIASANTGGKTFSSGQLVGVSAAWLVMGAVAGWALTALRYRGSNSSKAGNGANGNGKGLSGNGGAAKRAAVVEGSGHDGVDRRGEDPDGDDGSCGDFVGGGGARQLSMDVLSDGLGREVEEVVIDLRYSSIGADGIIVARADPP